MLEVKDLYAFYGRVPILKGVSLKVNKSEIVVIIGANGAGKSTLMRSIMGLITSKSKKGEIIFEEVNIENLAAENIVSLGMSLVFERRELFTNLTVKENLELGAHSRYRKSSKRKLLEDLGSIYNLFPLVKERSKQIAGTLSGGEQQMLAIGRALMAKPHMLLLDEPSMGLAPMIVREIRDVIKKLRTVDITILMVEQNTVMALNTGDRGYIIQNGEIVLEDSAENLLINGEIQNLYLGGTCQAEQL